MDNDKIEREVNKLKSEVEDMRFCIKTAYISVCVIILFLVMMLSSCTTTKYIEKPYPVPEIREVHVTDTLLKSDTLYVKDSTLTAQKGDTIYIEKWHTKYQTKWRDKEKIIVRCDSIPYEVVKTEYKTKSRLTWKDGLITLVVLAAGIFLIRLAKWRKI